MSQKGKPQPVVLHETGESGRARFRQLRLKMIYMVNGDAAGMTESGEETASIMPAACLMSLYGVSVVVCGVPVFQKSPLPGNPPPGKSPGPPPGNLLRSGRVVLRPPGRAGRANICSSCTAVRRSRSLE